MLDVTWEAIKNCMLSEGTQMCRLRDYILNPPQETTLHRQKG